MRKILISVLVSLLLIGTAFYMVNGMAKINVKGVKGLDEKNSELESKISELSNAISVTYQGAQSNLTKTASQLIDDKTEYENQAALSNLNSSNYVSGLEAYDIDYLWTKLGNYAKEEGVVIKIDVTAGGASSNLYNLNFSVGGTYIGATDFIYDIENDSKLGFKIDNFKMTSENTNAEIVATFTCKDIPLSIGNMEKTTQDTANTKNTTTNSTNSNTTNGNSNTTNANATNANTTNTSTNSNTSASSGSAENYGIQDPNKSNLTSIDSVVDGNKLKN